MDGSQNVKRVHQILNDIDIDIHLAQDIGTRLDTIKGVTPNLHRPIAIDRLMNRLELLGNIASQRFDFGL
jgi:hypothetical protein